jgi:hypothetical protein
MLVVAHLPEREAVTPEVAAAGVLRVEVLGVDAVDAVEGARELIAQALDDEVVVVRHQAESVDVETEALDCLPELGEEAAAVVAVEVDRAASDAARGRVPDAVVGKRGARQPGHARKLEPETPAKSPVETSAQKICSRTRLAETRTGTVPGRVRCGHVLSGGLVRSRTRPHS